MRFEESENAHEVAAGYCSLNSKEFNVWYNQEVCHSLSFFRPILDIALTAVLIGSAVLSRTYAEIHLFLPILLVVVTACSYWSTFRVNAFRAGWFLLITCGGLALSDSLNWLYILLHLISAALGCFYANRDLFCKRFHFYIVNQNLVLLIKAFGELKRAVAPHVSILLMEGLKLEDTMPQNQDNACVISLDIVKSTRLAEHPDYLDALNRMKDRCVSILQEGYDGFGKCSKGYRIKDMGDGLLCSVGYPYKSPDNRSNFEVAHELALRFSEVFDQEMSRLRFLEHPRCAMGIAFGDLRGFFPREGSCQYDLHGRVIMLATRYEGMRRPFLERSEDPLSGNIVFISKRVWYGLTTESRSRYCQWDCDSFQKTVRDDPQAEHAYYMVLLPSESNLENKGAA